MQPERIYQNGRLEGWNRYSQYNLTRNFHRTSLRAKIEEDYLHELAKCGCWNSRLFFTVEEHSHAHKKYHPRRRAVSGCGFVSATGSNDEPERLCFRV